MPYLIDKPINRKKFLKTSLKFAGALSASGLFYRFAYGGKQTNDLHLALLADTHIRAYQSEQYRGFFPYKNLQQVVQQVEEKMPELLLINGDVARLDGQLGDYVAIEELLTPITNTPVIMTLGNHDDRENFYNIFGTEDSRKQSILNKHVMVIERGNMQLILLDSLMFVNKTPGLLGSEQRDWLAGYLEKADDRPVFIFFHHTPYDGDSDLLDSDRMFNILSPFKKVKAVFFGHSHVYRFDNRDHIKLINQPAVGYNFIDSQPVGWIESWISPQKGIFSLHAIGGNIDKDGETREIFWN
jgi:3',5'-cyclic AMP phosphodiesterase CpdA